MISPLIGLIAGLIVSSTCGILVLGYHPKWKLSIVSILIFIIGAFFGAILTGFIYTSIFADNHGSLNSTFKVVGFFIALIIGTIMGGKVAVWFGYKYLNKFLRLGQRS